MNFKKPEKELAANIAHCIYTVDRTQHHCFFTQDLAKYIDHSLMQGGMEEWYAIDYKKPSEIIRDLPNLQPILQNLQDLLLFNNDDDSKDSEINKLLHYVEKTQQNINILKCSFIQITQCLIYTKRTEYYVKFLLEETLITVENFNILISSSNILKEDTQKLSYKYKKYFTEKFLYFWQENLLYNFIIQKDFDKKRSQALGNSINTNIHETHKTTIKKKKHINFDFTNYYRNPLIICKKKPPKLKKTTRLFNHACTSQNFDNSTIFTTEFDNKTISEYSDFALHTYTHTPCTNLATSINNSTNIIFILFVFYLINNFFLFVKFSKPSDKNFDLSEVNNIFHKKTSITI